MEVEKRFSKCEVRSSDFENSWRFLDLYHLMLTGTGRDVTEPQNTGYTSDFRNEAFHRSGSASKTLTLRSNIPRRCPQLSQFQLGLSTDQLSGAQKMIVPFQAFPGGSKGCTLDTVPNNLRQLDGHVFTRWEKIEAGLASSDERALKEVLRRVHVNGCPSFVHQKKGHVRRFPLRSKGWKAACFEEAITKTMSSSELPPNNTSKISE